MLSPSSGCYAVATVAVRCSSQESTVIGDASLVSTTTYATTVDRAQRTEETSKCIRSATTNHLPEVIDDTRLRRSTFVVFEQSTSGRRFGWPHVFGDQQLERESRTGNRLANAATQIRRLFQVDLRSATGQLRPDRLTRYLTGCSRQVENDPAVASHWEVIGHVTYGDDEDELLLLQRDVDDGSSFQTQRSMSCIDGVASAFELFQLSRQHHQLSIYASLLSTAGVNCIVTGSSRTCAIESNEIDDDGIAVPETDGHVRALSEHIACQSMDESIMTSMAVDGDSVIQTTRPASLPSHNGPSAAQLCPRKEKFVDSNSPIADQRCRHRHDHFRPRCRCRLRVHKRRQCFIFRHLFNRWSSSSLAAVRCWFVLAAMINCVSLLVGTVHCSSFHHLQTSSSSSSSLFTSSFSSSSLPPTTSSSPAPAVLSSSPALPVLLASTVGGQQRGARAGRPARTSVGKTGDEFATLTSSDDVSDRGKSMSVSGGGGNVQGTRGVGGGRRPRSDNGARSMAMIDGPGVPCIYEGHIKSDRSVTAFVRCQSCRPVGTNNE